MSAPSCPYCGAQAQLFTSSARFYQGRDFGPVWACLPCEAWVGCHPRTTTPLGRLADRELRRAKIRAHDAFDALWRAKQAREQISKGAARRAGYRWLAEQLQIDPAECHVGMMDVDRCEQVVALCRPYVERLRR